MKSIPGLTALLIFCCARTLAQEPVDSIDRFPPLTPSLSARPFVNFFCSLKELGNLSRVSVEWEVDSIMEGDYFIIERSNEGGPFEAVAAVRGSLSDSHYEWTDSAPPNGADLYRVRYADKENHPVYSRALSVSVSGELAFKFYPNPVDKLFIVRTEHLIDIQILDAFGNTRLSKRLQKGIQVINIAFLEKGSYVLRVADKESNRVVSNQLLKN